MSRKIIFSRLIDKNVLSAIERRLASCFQIRWLLNQNQKQKSKRGKVVTSSLRPKLQKNMSEPLPLPESRERRNLSTNCETLQSCEARLWKFGHEPDGQLLKLD